MKEFLTKFLAVVLITNYAYSQSPDDAIKFSENTFGTTARSLASGGAFGALGGDFSVLSQNPGGLGIYRKSELSFTPAFNLRKVDTKYLGTTANDSRFYFNFGSVGIVGSSYSESRSGWKGWNWAFGYNRENSFKLYSNYEGINARNSLLNSFQEQAYGVPVSSLADIQYAFGPGMAYDVYLLNPDTISNNYTIAVPHGGVRQREIIDAKGSTGNWLLSFSNNFNDKLFIGGTIEFKSLRYDMNSVYDETDVKDTIVSPYFGMNFKSFAFYRNETTTGTAPGFKLGMIFKPLDYLRIGAAIHSPFFYNLKYSDNYNMTSAFGPASDSTFNLDSPPSSSFDYKLTTPFRAIGSIAFVFPGKGLIDLDYEYVDHPSARLRAKDQAVYNFSTENNIIRKFHQGQHIIRLGGEYTYGGIAFRLGAAYYGSPYKSSVVPASYDYSSISYSGGIGFRDKNYFFDIGYALTAAKQFSELYSLLNGEQPGINSTINTHRLMLTLGFKF